MNFKLIILLCALSAAIAYPYANDEDVNAEVDNVDAQVPELTELQRVKRQFSGGGGGSPSKGYDISIDGRAPVWTSGNGRHQVDLSAGYSQHLGGPYGNSKPDYRGGVGYTFRF